MNEVYFNKCGKYLVSLATIILFLGLMNTIGVSVVAAQVADYPSKPVLFIALSSPGSGFDTTTRAIVSTLTKERLVPVAMPVENSTIAGGTALTVTRHKSDPYMISVQALGGMLLHVTGGCDYYHKDYTPLAGLLSTNFGIAVRYDSPYKTLGDLLKDLKERPEKTPISGGTTGDRLFYGATFMRAGINPGRINYVAFSGGGESSMIVLEGSAKAIVTAVDEIIGLLEGKKLRLLAISSEKRSRNLALKDVPTLKEAGIDLEWQNFRYAYAGPDMPEYAVKYWRNVFTKMAKTPTWQEMLKRYQWDDSFMIEGLNGYLDKKYAIVKEVLTVLGMAKRK